MGTSIEMGPSPAKSINLRSLPPDRLCCVDCARRPDEDRAGNPNRATPPAVNQDLSISLRVHLFRVPWIMTIASFLIELRSEVLQIEFLQVTLPVRNQLL